VSNACRACGAVDVLEGARFCRECGAAIPPPPARADERPSLTNDSRCPDCDGLLVRDALYCHSCGAAVTRGGEHLELADATPDEPRPAIPADIGAGTGVTLVALSAKYAATVSDAATVISRGPDTPPAVEPPAAPAPPRKTCSKCGAAAAEAAMFCRSCGTPLVARETHDQPVLDVSRCTICGAHDAGSSGLCTHCTRTMAS
jgi:hypothetical protein